MSSETDIRRQRRMAGLLFAAVFLIYLSLSPGAIGGMGYTMEEIVATQNLFHSPRAFFSGAEEIRYPRNGPVALLVHAPFVLSAEMLGLDMRWIDRAVSVEPALLSALLITLIFVWSRRLTGSAGWAALLALGTAFATMIWPYAYIGLETTQSVFLLAAGWLALEEPSTRSWPRTLTFAISATFALSAKSTGTFLVPAVLFLISRYFARADSWWGRPGHLPKLLATLTIVGGTFLVNSHYRSLFWVNFGGSANFVKLWIAHGPISIALNVVSFLFSANKGLVVYVPLALIALYVLPRVAVTHRWLAVFAILVLGGLAGGFSLLRNWSDETWGPRYLHSAIAPLILCVAASIGAAPYRRRFLLPVATAILLGAYPAFLGVFFYYGALHAAQRATSQPTLEALQFDPVWNHLRFNDRLLEIWLASDEPPPRRTWWTPEHKWFFIPPKDAPPWKSVDLAAYAIPQSAMIRTLEAEHRSPIDRRCLPFYLGSALAGAICLLAFVVVIRRS
ncbi:MAG TPA: hypothetical protein VGQ36_09265 [Thermoanaerobaculia bacterium]|nr:hypothetical protein [Thermoanaerobaculia bacterium]